jgi:hypothetical protein
MIAETRMDAEIAEIGIPRKKKRAKSKMRLTCL